MANQVATTVGDVPQEDLEVVEVHDETPDTWIIARECKYVGTVHPEVYGQVIRRDVWVTMKSGQAASAVVPNVETPPEQLELQFNRS